MVGSRQSSWICPTRPQLAQDSAGLAVRTRTPGAPGAAGDVPGTIPNTLDAPGTLNAPGAADAPATLGVPGTLGTPCTPDDVPGTFPTTVGVDGPATKLDGEAVTETE